MPYENLYMLMDGHVMLSCFLLLFWSFVTYLVLNPLRKETTGCYASNFFISLLVIIIYKKFIQVGKDTYWSIVFFITVISFFKIQYLNILPFVYTIISDNLWDFSMTAPTIFNISFVTLSFSRLFRCFISCELPVFPGSIFPEILLNQRYRRV